MNDRVDGKRRSLRTLVSAIAVALLASSVSAEPVRVTGEVVETSCFIRTGARGASHKKCAQLCARAGIPLALLDEKTEQLVWLGAEDHMESPNKLLEKFVAKRVTITGEFVERAGARLLIIDAVEPADGS